jgi:F0F1-type ATP synthase membrane subunit a
LGFSILIGIVLSGFIFAGQSFLQIVIPQNISKILLPFLVIIETISYLMRPFSLGIRLFANILAGHALVFILLFFTYFLFSLNFFSKTLFFLPFVMTFIIFFLELLVAFLQAYVFVVLIAIYLKDFIDFLPFNFYVSFLFKQFLTYLQLGYVLAKTEKKNFFFLSNIFLQSSKNRENCNRYFF